MKSGNLMFIAATAVLAVLVTTQASEAKIKYTRAHVVISFNNYYDLDLNHDGIADFTIKNGGNYRQYRLYASAPAGNGVVGSIGSNGAQAAALNRGEQIGPGQMFMAPDVTMRECIRFLGCWGDWDNVTNRYLGLKFIIHGKLHYGWARLNVQEKVFFTATLTGYAYETTAGKSIKAGQTQGAADEWGEEGFGLGASVMSPISDPPEPIPDSLAAQEHPAKHHQYNLIDIGTLGGPNFFFNFSGYPNRLLGNHGTVTGGVDTSIVDSLCFNNPDCFTEHAFKWQEGVLSDLGALPGGSGNNNSQAFWINHRGQTVGVSTIGTVDPLVNYPFYRAVLWSDHGKILDLGTLGGQYGVSQAINSRGQVVGVAANAIADPYNLFDYIIWGISAGTQSRAFLWDKETGMQDLGTLGVGNDAYAEYVNERGQVAGWSYTNTTPNPVATFDCGNGNVVPTQDPFFWENGKMTDLGTFGGNCGVVRGLNNKGQVIGFSYLAGDVVYQPFRWDKKGGMKNLGLLGGIYGATYGINDTGDATGWADLAGDLLNHAVLWPNGTTTPIDLGVVTGYAQSIANAINSRSQIVGCVTNGPNCGGSSTAAFLWENGDMVDLNTVVPPHPDVQLDGGDDYINDQGEILTSATLSNGDRHAFLLTPCDDNHRDGGDCGERAEGAAVAQSTSAPVTQNPATTTKVGPSPLGRMGALRGRLGGLDPNGVPQSGTVGKAEADYITDEMPFKLSGHCMLNFVFYNGECFGKRGGVCTGNRDLIHCPPGKRGKRFGLSCNPMIHVDPTSRCSLR